MSLTKLDVGLQGHIASFLMFTDFEFLFATDKTLAATGRTDYIWLNEAERAIAQYGDDNETRQITQRTKAAAKHELHLCFYVCYRCHILHRDVCEENKEPDPDYDQRYLTDEGPLCPGCDRHDLCPGVMGATDVKYCSGAPLDDPEMMVDCREDDGDSDGDRD